MKNILLTLFYILSFFFNTKDLVGQTIESHTEYFYVEKGLEKLSDSIVLKNPYFNNSYRIIVKKSTIKLMGSDDFLELNIINKNQNFQYDLKLDNFEENIQIMFRKTRLNGIYTVSKSEILDFIPSGLYIEKKYLKGYIDVAVFQNMDYYELLNIGELNSKDSISYYYKVPR